MKQRGDVEDFEDEKETKEEEEEEEEENENRQERQDIRGEGETGIETGTMIRRTEDGTGEDTDTDADTDADAGAGPKKISEMTGDVADDEDNGQDSE
jgi:hypothetical protein